MGLRALLYLFGLRALLYLGLCTLVGIGFRGGGGLPGAPPPLVPPMHRP
jgi:hypothetical protein